MTVFWGSVLGVVVWSVSRFTSGGARRVETEENPMNIAQKRFARGEITREQFQQIRETLQD